MKKVILLSLCLFASVILRAQPTTDEIGLIQSAYGMEKRAIVEKYMKLTEAEATGFWKVYEAYEVSRKELGKKRFSTIVDYANNYANLTDAKATELVKQAMNIQMSISKLQQSTFSKMAKVISPKRAAQFIQLENYLETVIRLNITDDIPFIGELDDLRKN
jgi:Spy/CpxP family protein refolding chaperone